MFMLKVILVAIIIILILKKVKGWDSVDTGMAIFWAFLIIVAVGVIRFGVWLFSDLDSGPEYETYYQDENGNGEFDRGEWNWTQDEDGNIVDIDDDGSNF